MLQIFTFLVFIYSAVIHEYMHGWTADRLGDPTAKDQGRLTLNPLSHIDLFGSILMPLMLFLGTGGNMIFGYAKPVPFNPYNLRDQKYGAAKVAASGPLANLATAIFFGMLLRFFPFSNYDFTQMLSMIVWVNLLLAIFNLIPLPPLDGSKVLAAFLPYRWQIKYLELEKYGIFILLLFIMFGFEFIQPIIALLYSLIIGINI